MFWQFGNDSTFYRRLFEHLETVLLLTSRFFGNLDILPILQQTLWWRANTSTFYHTKISNFADRPAGKNQIPQMIFKCLSTSPRTVILVPILVLHVQVICLRIRVHKIPAVLFDVRVNDGDHPPSLGSQGVDHVGGVRELDAVPREVLLAVGVLDVEPQEVVGEVDLVKLDVNAPHVLLVIVVPPGVMETDGKQLRKKRFFWTG